MNQDQASIVFTAQHAAVRDALEASVPKLREMMNDQQINLVNVSVAQNGGSEQRNSQPQSFNQVNGEAAVDAADDLGITEHEHVTVSNGLLNMYA
jgi:flagellar hook-length control protein FliK